MSEKKANPISILYDIIPNNNLILFCKKVKLFELESDTQAIKEIVNGFLNCKNKDEINEYENIVNQYLNEKDTLSKNEMLNFIIFEQPKFSVGKVYINQEIYLEYNKSVGFEGFGKCRRCQGTKLIPELKQTRAADEGFTTKYKCPNCNIYVK